MDLVDLIEDKRFVGREFLAWLWFESELFEGTLATTEGTIGLWLEAQLTLEGAEGSQEQSRLRGAAPSLSPEAREALRQGKLPTQAKIRLERHELGFSFALDADALALTGVKIPATLKEEGDEDEGFYDRIHRIEELEAIVGSLYAEFVTLRLSKVWTSIVVPAMRAWIAGEDVDADGYTRDKAQAKARARGKRELT
jgi:hypothetical protein